jgi:serine/threonine protein kinase
MTVTITRDMHPGYQLRRPRGRGGFGQVWEAENDKGVPVALKFMPCNRDQGATQELRSIQVVKELSHTHLVRIDKVWCAADNLVVAMELADGSLADLFEIYRAELGTPFPPHHILPLLAQAAAALDFLNNRQHSIKGLWATIQHCDVTPANLLVFGETVKLSDFGLTTTLVEQQKLHYRAGTPSFAAPEVFQGIVSHRTDQYSLACCYCLLRGGRLPFSKVPSTFQTNYVRPAPDLSMLEPAERRAVARALAVLPADRWPSCRDLILELQKVTSQPPVGNGAARPERRSEPRHEPEQRVDCQVLPTLGNHAWHAEVQNLSQGGAGLHIARPGCELKPGRLLELVLTSQARGQGVRVSLRLAHSTEVANGDYEVGGAFVQPLGERELAVLAQRLQA